MTQGATGYLSPMYSVDVNEDVFYGESRNVDGQLESLRLDVYSPVDDPRPLRPAILWFHGGGFRPGNDKRQIYVPMFARAFASRGYVCVAPDYRVRVDPRADLPGTVRDAVADGRMALDWVRENHAAYGIDPGMIALAGGSAGGMLVINLVHLGDQPVIGSRDGVFALLSMWGAPGIDRCLFRKVNPESPPTLIVHGTADQLVPYANALELASDLEAAGVEAHLLTLQGAPHTPVREHWDEIVEATARFLQQQVDRSLGSV